MENLRINKATNTNFGLNLQEVEGQKKLGKINTTLTKTSKSYKKIFIENLCTWFNFICFFIAGLLISVGSYKNIAFVFIFLANLLIGLVQEIRAKKVVDNISVITKSKVRVLREKKEIYIDIEKIVEGDIVFFEAGQQICADCVILEGKIESNESLITGESKPVKKSIGDTIWGGSFVVSGTCKAQAIAVGLETYSSSLIKKAREFKSNNSDILKTLNFVIKTIGIIIIPLGILTFIDAYKNNGFTQSIIKTSGSIIGMMPVGMFLLTSVSLVVGVIKIARKRALVQDLYSIETLARANVLCLDKTGTLTDGTMKVAAIVPINTTTIEVAEVMSNYISASTSNNQTQEALKNYFVPKNDYEIEDKIEFNSERKYSAITFKDFGTYLLGAPEFVTKNLKADLKETIKDFAKQGFRVLILCKSKDKIVDGEININNEPIAIITIQDNIRPDAKDTINWFKSNDVKIKIISGDNVDTVSNISKKVGVENADCCISLAGLSDEEVIDAAAKYTVFGRVTPEQKCLIVKALKQQNNKVAMTGDGVNDILALKEADCSIAMASGSEATRSASNLVMLDDNFSALPYVVEEGRRVINNISKSSSLFLTKTFFTMFLTIFVLIAPSFSYPLQTNQILLWETFFVGIPSFFLALQPNNKRIKGSFIADLTSKALPSALVLFLATMGCYIYCNVIGNISILSTLISYTVTFGAFAILFSLCYPLDKFRTTICISMLLLCVLGFTLLPKNFFEYVAISYKELIFIVISYICITILYYFIKKFFERFFEKKFKIGAKQNKT